MVAEMADVLTMTPAGDGRFVATMPSWHGDDFVFGGVIVGLAVGAVQQTVEPARRIHSLHGYFLRPGIANHEVEAVVEPVREGRSFTTKRVSLRQDGKATFEMTCSFHVGDEGDEYQLPMPAGVPRPEAIVAEADIENEGPFENRHLGPTPPEADGTYRSTHRVWFRLGAPLGDDPAVHTSILAYLSDMTGSGARPRSLGEWGNYADASLDHAVWFHRPARADEWLYFDVHALINHAGRSAIRATMHDVDGRLVLSMAQEMLIRRLG